MISPPFTISFKSLFILKDVLFYFLTNLSPEGYDDNLKRYITFLLY